MKKLALLSLVLLIPAIGIVNAQTEISPEKKKAIKELVGLMNEQNKTTDFVRIMMVQMDSMREEIIKSIIDERTDLTDEEREFLRTSLIEEANNQSKKIRERMLAKLDFNTLMDEIVVSVYDKFYTLEEINDLIAFYKTPTGQKTLKTMQPLMIETMRLTQERITPKVIAVMNELREEEKTDLAKKAEEIKPRKKKSR